MTRWIVKWASRAESDLDRYLGYVAGFNAPAADRIDLLVQSKVARLVDFPNVGSPLSNGRRKVRVGGTPLVVTYRVIANTIRIIRVFHERQDWR